MKKLNTIILLVVSYIGYSQTGAMATFDFTQALNMSESINAGLEQLDQLDKMIDYYQKVEDKIQKVNRVILRLNRLKEIIIDQKYIFGAIGDAKKFIMSIEDYNKKRMYVNKLRNILRETQEATNELSQITKDNFLNLSDKERLDLIEKNESIINYNKTRLKLLYNTK